MTINGFKSKVAIIQKSWKAINSIALIMGLITLAILIVLFVSNINQSDSETSSQAVKKIECGTTPDELLKSAPDQSDFKTITEIASINYDTEVTSGAFKKNDIPSLTNPIFTDYREMDRCLSDNSIVVVVQAGSIIRLYPKEVLQYHFAINDNFGGQNLLITYSPISDAYRVYKRNYKAEVLNFGVSGKLYNNNDLLFDTKTESFWSQFDGVARVGNLTGAKLERYPFRLMDYLHAKQLFAKAAVLSFDTGYRINYLYDISGQFISNPTATATNVTDGLALVEQVVGFTDNGIQYVVPLSVIDQSKDFVSKVENRKLLIQNNGGEMLGYLGETTSPNLRLDLTYWYTWKAFYPDTKIIN
jgi:hypothetical protein